MKRFVSTILPSSRKAVATLAAVVTLAAAGTGTALANPGHHRGGHAHGAGIGAMLHAAKAKLNLDTSQQLAWDNAVAHSHAARNAARANRHRIHEALQAELAKAEPDLAAVAAVADEVAQQNRGQRVQVRNDWLGVYARLAPEQKAVVRDGIQQRMARAAKIREHMRERFHHRQGGNG